MWFPALLAWVGGEQVSGIDPLTGGRGGGGQGGRPSSRGCAARLQGQGRGRSEAKEKAAERDGGWG